MPHMLQDLGKVEVLTKTVAHEGSDYIILCDTFYDFADQVHNTAAGLSSCRRWIEIQCLVPDPNARSPSSFQRRRDSMAFGALSTIASEHPEQNDRLLGGETHLNDESAELNLSAGVRLSLRGGHTSPTHLGPDKQWIALEPDVSGSL